MNESLAIDQAFGVEAFKVFLVQVRAPVESKRARRRVKGERTHTEPAGHFQVPLLL